MSTAARPESRAAANWQSLNQARLVAELEDLKNMLNRYVERTRSPAKRDNTVRDPIARGIESEWRLPPEARFAHRPPDRDIPPAESAPGSEQPSALDTICGAFSLSLFERTVLLLCAAIELDSAFAPLCAAAHGDPGRAYPTFSLALAALPDAHWSALAPNAPLRRWRLIELGSGPTLTTACLRIDERVLHSLAGLWHLDERLAGMIEPIPPVAETDLAPSQARVAAGVAAAWTAQRGKRNLPAAQLCSPEPAECRGVATAAAAAIGLRAAVLPADLIPASVAELDSLLRLWEREAALSGALILVECDPDSAGERDGSRAGNAIRFAERISGPVIISALEPQRIKHRPVVTFYVQRPTPAEQRAAWRAALNPATPAETCRVDALASQFSLNLNGIHSGAAEALGRAAASPGSSPSAIAWQVCRARCRSRLDGLAQRIEPAAGWEDLVLPGVQVRILQEIAGQVRQRAVVYETWGFADKSARGLGISALFSGPSGTGKTMGAEVLARHLELDLYRIDLASVVSKYIGETEKNLRRVFDAAEESGAILLFDEADALFGKRSEVKDSHDRYANIEVSYLLQRMEAYRGLAILTTNLQNALDTAFLRRLRFLVEFPFPDLRQRGEIWRRIFPPSTPTENLDFGKLARLNIAGGDIRNVAVNAAFLAAEAGDKIRMAHLVIAARAEFAKLERPLAEAEIGDWI
jgi:hypothetical protein